MYYLYVSIKYYFTDNEINKAQWQPAQGRTKNAHLPKGILLLRVFIFVILFITLPDAVFKSFGTLQEIKNTEPTLLWLQMQIQTQCPEP